MTQAGQRIEKTLALRARMADIAGRHGRNFSGQERTVPPLLVGVGVTPELDEEILPEDRAQSPGQRGLSHDADLPGRMLPQIVERDAAMWLGIGRVPARE